MYAIRSYYERLFAAERLMFAVGTEPATEGIGLEAACVP